MSQPQPLVRIRFEVEILTDEDTATCIGASTLIDILEEHVMAGSVYASAQQTSETTITNRQVKVAALLGMGAPVRFSNYFLGDE